MNYKPKHKEFENPEIEISDEPTPPSMFESFAYRSQVKLSYGDISGSHSATDAFLVLFQDLISKKIVDETSFVDLIRQNLLKSIHGLRKKNY